MVLVAYRHRLSGGQIGSIRPTSSHHFSLIFLASAANPSFRSAARRTVTSKFISLLPRPLDRPLIIGKEFWVRLRRRSVWRRGFICCALRQRGL